MSEGEIVLQAHDVNVVFEVYEDADNTLRSDGEGRTRRQKRKVHAVRGLDVVLHEGESVGVIGLNGSGKSTLLAALCGLVPMQSGRIRARSRPTLLGVGAALRPQLSGRANIMVGGLALGMRRQEVADRMEELIEFTGLRKSIDLPLRTYSSGMRARLAFTVATAIDPDVLMIDEALAVGDDEFRARSEQRIEELRANAGAIMLVSHNLNEIRRSCSRVIWMREGELEDEGPTDEILDKWEHRRQQSRERRLAEQAAKEAEREAAKAAPTSADQDSGDG